MTEYTDREQTQVEFALNYANNFQEAGVPGHNLFLLIAKLAEELALVKGNLREAYRQIETLDRDGRKPAGNAKNFFTGE